MSGLIFNELSRPLFIFINCTRILKAIPFSKAKEHFVGISTSQVIFPVGNGVRWCQIPPGRLTSPSSEYCRASASFSPCEMGFQSFLPKSRFFYVSAKQLQFFFFFTFYLKMDGWIYIADTQSDAHFESADRPLGS